MSSQIGQPAACMMENKGGFRGVGRTTGIMDDARNPPPRLVCASLNIATLACLCLYLHPLPAV
jgi:hypothetical protein